jgi:hypothetical protein
MDQRSNLVHQLPIEGDAVSRGWVHPNRQPLPSNWEAIRRETAARAGGQCEARGSAWPWPSASWMGPGGRCTQAGTEADHVVNRASNEPSGDETQWLCSYHHAWKTAQESAAARAKQRAKLTISPEKPPGLR